MSTTLTDKMLHKYLIQITCCLLYLIIVPVVFVSVTGLDLNQACIVYINEDEANKSFQKDMELTIAFNEKVTDDNKLLEPNMINYNTGACISNINAEIDNIIKADDIDSETNDGIGFFNISALIEEYHSNPYFYNLTFGFGFLLYVGIHFFLDPAVKLIVSMMNDDYYEEHK